MQSGGLLAYRLTAGCYGGANWIRLGPNRPIAPACPSDTKLLQGFGLGVLVIQPIRGVGADRADGAGLVKPSL
jgi:hypothetical protein